MKVRFSFWPRVLAFLVLVPLAAFLGRGVINGALSAVLIILLTTRSLGLQDVRRQLLKYLAPLAVGLLLLHLILGTGSPASRIAEWLVSVARFGVLLGFGLLFSEATDPLDFPRAAKQLRLPDSYGVGLLVAYRLVPLLGDRIATIILAQRARGAAWRLSPRGIRQLPWLTMSLIVPSLYTTLEASLAFSDALYVRGYRAGCTLAAPPPTSASRRSDTLLLLASFAILALATTERAAQ